MYAGATPCNDTMKQTMHSLYVLVPWFLLVPSGQVLIGDNYSKEKRGGGPPPCRGRGPEFTTWFLHLSVIACWMKSKPNLKGGQKLFFAGVPESTSCRYFRKKENATTLDLASYHVDNVTLQPRYMYLSKSTPGWSPPPFFVVETMISGRLPVM